MTSVCVLIILSLCSLDFSKLGAPNLKISKKKKIERKRWNPRLFECYAVHVQIRGIYTVWFLCMCLSLHSSHPKKRKLHKFVGWWKEIDKNAFENGQRKKLCVGEKVEKKTSNKSLRDPIKIQKGPLSNVCIKKRATNSCLRLSIGRLIVSHEKKRNRCVISYTAQRGKYLK